MSTLTRSSCGPRRNQRRFALSEMPSRDWTSEYVPLRVAASQFCPASKAAPTTGQLGRPMLTPRSDRTRARVFCVGREEVRMIQVVATLVTKPGLRTEVLNVFQETAPAVRAESGCIEYAAFVDLAGLGRDHIGIKGLKQGDSAGIVAGEGRLDLGCDPRFQPRHGLWTHLGQEV